MQNHIWELRNNKLFEHQLTSTVRKFPNLRIAKGNLGIPFLKGILDIPNDNNEIVGHFLIELHQSKNFPFTFPILFEIGGEIPNEGNWHKYKDGSCCITVLADEILKCQNGITLIGFIENFAIPYFANQIYKKQVGEYKNGEYSHGIRGIYEFYKTLLKTHDTNLWIKYFRTAFEDLKVDYKRNNLCFCGSNEKYKNCHLAIIQTLRQIGEKVVLHDFKLIIK